MPGDPRQGRGTAVAVEFFPVLRVSFFHNSRASAAVSLGKVIVVYNGEGEVCALHGQRILG